MCLIIACSIIDLSCTKEVSAPKLELLIKGKFKDKPLVFAPGFSYDYFDGSKISFTRSEFFLSHLEMLNEHNEYIPFGDIYHVELQNHHISIEKANEGYKISLTLNQKGTFKGIRFGLGLDSLVNKKAPSDYSNDNILAIGDNYWSGWKSYIFSKTEGSLSNSTKSILFAYHSGFNESYRTIHIVKSFNLNEDQTTSFVIEIDHSKIFGNPADYIGIYDNNIVHEGTNFLSKFMDQFQLSFN
ncbi:MAG: MbnP family protein [Saprospiraceae bacterium]